MDGSSVVAVESSSMQASPEDSRRRIVDLAHQEARAFLLKPESYMTLEMPTYFQFGPLLHDVATFLESEPLPRPLRARDFDGVNHRLLTNKDGRHAWRPIDLVHPFLYVDLVNKVTQPDHWEEVRAAFQRFEGGSRIQCLSLPVNSLTAQTDKAEQVLGWWHDIEQKSIALSLQYDIMTQTDVVDCYASIYTHSIPWALHTRSKAKDNRKDWGLIGNIIDTYVQGMNQGQTNGIPQGSVLMDCFSELVLGYADEELYRKIHSESIEDYSILRYRDDYRIFVNSTKDGEVILKCLTEVMIDLGLKLNPGKTTMDVNVIRNSIKSDKLDWMVRGRRPIGLQKYLLVIHEHSQRFPNSGSLATEMSKFYRRLMRVKGRLQDIQQLIAITTDIAYHNPRVYPTAAAVLGKLVSLLEDPDEKAETVATIRKRFARIPNIGYLEVWLQRISQGFAPDMEFDEVLCRVVSRNNSELWNSQWMDDGEARDLVEGPRIVDWDELRGIEELIPVEEVDLFRVSDY